MGIQHLFILVCGHSVGHEILVTLVWSIPGNASIVPEGHLYCDCCS